ncbi:hypothetical protein TWF106_010780 [Orbilia oligospora]|uniref:Uncharacterized protein n=1 Tax=Orbilia oligospora TaxID=2813651 RepID=A0A6G1MPV8_ORBOL|nr:hypothetical protein TWF106_010780 [Orbilia oligospora]KAF3265563.1 hypothetical protein TWF192_000212 [Orbilia oligospora]
MRSGEGYGDPVEDSAASASAFGAIPGYLAVKSSHGIHNGSSPEAEVAASPILPKCPEGLSTKIHPNPPTLQN